MELQWIVGIVLLLLVAVWMFRRGKQGGMGRSSVADETQRLWELKERGALTPSEFNTQMAEILKNSSSADTGRQVDWTNVLKEHRPAQETNAGTGETYFVRLLGSNRKLETIKALREILRAPNGKTIDLLSAKMLVEVAPVTILRGMSRSRAEELRKVLEASGAMIDMRAE